MAIAFAARAVPAWFAAAGTLVVVAPCGDSASGYPVAAARRGWQSVAVALAPTLRPPPGQDMVTAAYTTTVEHNGSLRRTVKQLRALGAVTAVVAGSAPGIDLAERIAWHLGLPGPDPAASVLRHDRGAQAAALLTAGIPAPRSVRTTSLAAALEWVRTCGLRSYVLGPAAAGVPVQPVVCSSGLEISAAWPDLREAARHHSGSAHLVLTEYLPGRQYVVNSVTRHGDDGGPDHIITDVWAETRTRGGLPDRSDLMNRQHLLSRALSLYVLRTLDVLGVACGPVSSRLVYDNRRGPLLLSALALPAATIADAAAQAATGRDRFGEALDAASPPQPPPARPAGNRHRVVRVHLRPRDKGGIDPGMLRELPTVVRISSSLQRPAKGATGGEVVLSAAQATAVEADYRVIRALEHEGLHQDSRREPADARCPQRIPGGGER
ncbi:hypothetical protein ACFWD7_28035 [Streptomyces mirabilis]|uniref:hypothetical protein n=1 Tax=Streptomyces mirabilis TaxID=68239 RepID=UPI0036A3B4A4